MRLSFPFSAIVGQEEMKQAILVAAVDPGVGGVLVFGDRGTGKSTAVRALAAMLPKMRAMTNCPYGCDPELGTPSCKECAPLKAKGNPKTVLRDVPVVDLPLGATEDRVVGALLAWLDWRLFLVVLACAALIRAVLVLLQRRQDHFDAVSTGHVKEQGARMIAMVTAMRTTRVFGQEERERARFADVCQRVFRAGFAWYAVGAAIMPVVSAAMAAVFVLVLVIGWQLQVPAPALIAYVILLARREPYAAAVGQARSGISGVTGRVREVEWLLRQEPEPESKGEPCAALDAPVRFAGVRYAYPNGAEALHGVDFIIEPGVATALIGHSGAGKSDRKSTRLNSSHTDISRMPSSA